MSIKESVRTALRRYNVEVGNYRHTVPARRQLLLSHYSIGRLVDIGANVGQYAAGARRGGYQGEIVSFEPVTQAWRRLLDAACDDGRWSVHKVAIGATDGSITINVSEGDIFSSALPVAAATVEASPNSVQISTENVSMRSLDSMLTELDGGAISPMPTALKIDVQGFERDVLLGADQTLRQARIVEIELSPSAIYEGQMLLTETIDRMSTYGFELSLTENLFPERVSGRSLQFNGIFVRPTG